MLADRLSLLNTISTNTIAYRLKDWIQNFNANQKHIQGGYGVASLIDTLQGVPCIIVGSGPTLDHNIPILKTLNNKACIIACDSTAKTLINNEIRPNIILSTDSKGKCKEFFDGIDTSQYNFVLDSFCHPDTIEFIQGRKYFYNTLPVEGCDFTQTLNQWTGYIGNLGTGGCVATTIWSMAAQLLKCDPNILVGLPQAFYDKCQQYSRLVIDTNHRGIDQYESEPLADKDIWGKDCYTQPGFQSFAFWFEDAALYVPGIHINCSDGLICRNWLNMTLQQVADRYLNVSLPDGQALTFDIEGMLFIKENSITDMLAQTNNQKYEFLKPMLTIMLDGPSLTNLSLRMGWTEQATLDQINALRDDGFDIDETRNVVSDPIGQPVETVAFTLKGINEKSRDTMCEGGEQGTSKQESSIGQYATPFGTVALDSETE
jgi:hypothetical protein